MTEQQDEKWWSEILVPTLEAFNRPMSFVEIINVFPDDNFFVGNDDLELALQTLEARGVLEPSTANGRRHWSVAKLATESLPIAEQNGRGLKDEAVRALLDLIEKAHQKGDARCVSVLERTIVLIYSNEPL